MEETTSYLDWVMSLHIAHRQLKSDFSPRTVIKGNDARVTIRNKEGKKGSTVDQDIMVELQNGELKVTATATNLQEATEDGEQAYIWKGQENEMSLKDRIKSWVG